VKQLDAQVHSLKKITPSPRHSAPSVPANSFIFQPSDEYPFPVDPPSDDPDVWSSPSRVPSRTLRSRKSNQNTSWSRNSSRASVTTHGSKSGTLHKSGIGTSTTVSSSTKKGKLISTNADLEV
jgi:hypothetical protein